MKELLNELWIELINNGVTNVTQNKLLILLSAIDIKQLSKEDKKILYKILIPFIIDNNIDSENKDIFYTFFNYLNNPKKKNIEWNRNLELFNEKNVVTINDREVEIEELEKKGIEYIDLIMMRPNKGVPVEKYKIRVYHDGQIEKIVEYKVQKKDKENQLWNDFMQIICNKELML